VSVLQQYRYNSINSLRTTNKLVQEHAEIQKLIQKNRYDKSTINREFFVGDLVWVKIPNPQIDNNTISHKLRPKYQGPCRLIEKLSPSTFIVLRLQDNVNLGVTNIDRIKLYYEPQNTNSSNSNLTNNSSSSLIRRYPLRERRPPRIY